jgi:hypothetical protein
VPTASMGWHCGRPRAISDWRTGLIRPTDWVPYCYAQCVVCCSTLGSFEASEGKVDYRAFIASLQLADYEGTFGRTVHQIPPVRNATHCS